MASPGEIVQALAVATGIPEPTVAQHDRNLVLAALRTKGGRGRSAAKVTVQDAANLLVALLGSPLVKSSAATVRRYMHAVSMPGQTWEAINIPELARLPAGHCFVDAIGAVIEAGMSGSLRSVLLPPITIKGKEFAPPLLGPSSRFRILVQSPHTIADIQIHGAARANGMSCEVRYAIPGPTGTTPWHLEEWKQRMREADPSFEETNGDLLEYREIGLRSILALSKILST